MTTLLTIAIPTYNRAEKLEKQLGRVVPFLTSEIRCVVYDNASTDTTREVVRKFAGQGVGYECGPTNLGIGRNLLRCFETCGTPWLWVLSDDDPFSDQAISFILRTVRTTDCDFIHTSSPLNPHEEDVEAGSITQAFEHSSLSALFWISAGIYRMSSLGTYLSVFASSISTWVPQTLMLLASLESGSGKVLFSKERIIESSPSTPRFSTLDFIIRLMEAPEYLQRESSRSAVARAIIDEHLHWALLLGLREVRSREDVGRWKRIARQTTAFLAAYAPPESRFSRFLRCFKAGQRRQSLQRVKSGVTLGVFRHSPSWAFEFLMRHYPLPSWIRQELPAHGGKFAAPRY